MTSEDTTTCERRGITREKTVLRFSGWRGRHFAPAKSPKQTQTHKHTTTRTEPFPQELSGSVLAGFGAPSFLGVPARGLLLQRDQERPSAWFTTRPGPSPSPGSGRRRGSAGYAKKCPPGPCLVESAPVCSITQWKNYSKQDPQLRFHGKRARLGASMSSVARTKRAC